MSGFPRTERMWMYGLCAVAVVLVLAGVFGAVKIWRGDVTPPPQYENTPAIKLAAPDESGIADLTNAERPPISDEDFLALHRGTSSLIRSLAAGDLSRLSRVQLERSVSADADADLQEIAETVRDAKMSDPKDVYLTRPVNDKAQSGGNVTVAALDANGQSSRASVRFTFYWVKADGEWKVFGLSSKLDADAGSLPSGEDGTAEPEAEPAEDPSGVDGISPDAEAEPDSSVLDSPGD